MDNGLITADSPTEAVMDEDGAEAPQVDAMNINFQSASVHFHCYANWGQFRRLTPRNIDLPVGSRLRRHLHGSKEQGYLGTRVSSLDNPSVCPNSGHLPCAYRASIANQEPWPIPVVLGFGLFIFGTQLGATGVVTYLNDICYRNRVAEALAGPVRQKYLYVLALHFT